MSNISAARDSILRYELKLRPNDQDKTINSSDVKGRDHLDSNSSGTISLRELQTAAKKAGVDISRLTIDEKQQLQRELSTFVKQGGAFAASEGDPTLFSFKITPTINDVKSGAKSPNGEVQTFSNGQSGTAIIKLNKLLDNLGFDAKGDKFTDKTENFVKDFQLRHFFTKDPTTGEMKPKPGYENIKLGVVDAKTLEIMEEATKLENPYESPSPDNGFAPNPSKPSPQTTTPNPPNQNNNAEANTPPIINPPTGNTNHEANTTLPTQTTPLANDDASDQVGGTSQVEASRPTSPGEVGQFERVRNAARNQIIDSFKSKGMSQEDAEKKAEDSLKLGGKLTETAVKQDRAMGTENMCYTAVKRNLEKAMGISYKRYTNNSRGDSARTATNTLFKENASSFVKLQLPRADVQYLPPGTIVVYSPTNKSVSGHIGVQTIQLKTPQQSASGTAQGLPVTNVHEKDGQIVGLDVKVGRNTIKYTVENGKVFDDKGKPTNLSLDHADISDKQRNNPWASATVDVFFPVAPRG